MVTTLNAHYLITGLPQQINYEDHACDTYEGENELQGQLGVVLADARLAVLVELSEIHRQLATLLPLIWIHLFAAKIIIIFLV